MIIQTITVPHPSINDRKITLLLFDGKIDIPSTEFLVYESRYGGRHGGIGGRTSNHGKAVKLAELYRNLNEMNLTWDTATEVDIEIIRNAMLCWDRNGNTDYENFPYEPIKNNSMNHKLGVWFKFYKYMDKINIKNDMVLTTRRIKIYKPKGMLDHLNKRYDGNSNDYVDTWILRVKSSPTTNAYHALSRTEFSKFRQYLRNIDVVYEMLALFMVETGLRLAAALEAVESDFKGLLRLHASGKGMNDVTKVSYIAKGGFVKQYELPLRTMQEINESYLIRTYNDRLYEYEKRNNRLEIESKDNILWITKKGKEVKRHDIWSAFNLVSKLMNRTVNNITPHWMRHTFATWTIIDIATAKGIPLENTGTTPNPIILSALQLKLGHADPLTAMRYIVTALKLMGLDVNDGPIKMSLRSFKRNKASQNLVKREAIIEFGDDFDEDYFNILKYAISREIVIDDDIIKEKS